ncbi:eukaryotic peptide chain release factor GTP-binding subunit ERF3A isoform X2 [Adelges cooleyi]|uniref:eukaryotic peptide chain release factor GTP-binding subunit ERF3A isoform X2 n=1 Tax=Adelges cooleyi TaxID=133065 RepID=UPI00217F62B1|nr:eukaryotic peptide chain release factor GTP-binding subunit ERF3A isoform X2 [Adelges cooleyi]XP_050422036.1 eukaryotic peptide chain release factor GTP-binding subunit ERF3A isoform X2 [Adelges cooleyi]
MSNNVAPDSWEENELADASAAELQAKLIKLNVNAVEFVPSFSPASGNADDANSEEDEQKNIDTKTSNVDGIGDPPAIDGDGGQTSSASVLDSWEDGASSTPEDGTAKPIIEDIDIEADEEEKPKPTPKKPIESLEPKAKKEHINIVIIGHVDAGKSTIGGQIMALTGMVDKRTLDKYEKEAKERSRESWYLSWALDTNQEEREKGKTVEVGRAYFETEKKHFTILDAPGHKSFVPNMIGGTAQADLAVLVISARKGEFETGFDRGGQTREHAMLAKTAGVKHMVVLINKMDDPTVLWSKARYEECRDKILPYLRKLGFNVAKDLTFMPVSGQTGLGLKDQVDESICPWYRGPAFIPFIDGLPLLNRRSDGPFIMPVVEKYKDMGTVLMGKVESGEAKKSQSLLIMPNRTHVIVDQLWSDDEEVSSVGPGENIKVKLKGIEEEDVSPGFILCDPIHPVKTCRIFDGQVVILEYKSIICAGYSAVMHIHCVAEVVEVKALICLVDRKTGLKSNMRPRFVKQDQVVIMRLECSGVVCLEEFKLFPQMGRFTLRDEGKTIAIGKVLKIIE